MFSVGITELDTTLHSKNRRKRLRIRTHYGETGGIFGPLNPLDDGWKDVLYSFSDNGYLDNNTYKMLIPTAWVPLLDANELNGCLQVCTIFICKQWRIQGGSWVRLNPLPSRPPPF